MPVVSTFQELFQEQLLDMYDAEQQMLEALPKLIDAVNNDELCEAIESHLKETRDHVARLEEVFDLLGMAAEERHCVGMAGILKEGINLLDTEGEDAVL